MSQTAQEEPKKPPAAQAGSSFSWHNRAAVCVARDMFTRSRCIVSLFGSLPFADRSEGWDSSPGAWLERNRDRRIVFSNPYRDPQTKALYDMCRATGHKLCVIERGPLPDTVFIDGAGFLADSDACHAAKFSGGSMPEDWRETIRAEKAGYLAAGAALEPQSNDRAVSAALMARAAQGLRRPVILIALQMPEDTVTRHFTQGGRSYQAFLEFCQTCIERFSGRCAFVFKPHPRAAFPGFDGAANLSHIHIDDALAHCDGVLTFNSGVGVLAMMHDKPSAVFGRAFYAAAPSVTAVADLDGMARFIDDLTGRRLHTQSDDFLYHLTQRVLSRVIFIPQSGIWRRRKVAFLARKLRVYDGENFHAAPQQEPTILDFGTELMSASARRAANLFG